MGKPAGEDSVADGPAEVVHWVRWLLPLPELLPLPDGWAVTERVADVPDAAGQGTDPAVTVIIHQVHGTDASTVSVHQAVAEVARRIQDAPTSTAADRTGATEPPHLLTVVEALTVGENPDAPTAFDSPADLPPRTDGLMRCLRLVNDLVRAYRATTEVPVALPSYERLPRILTSYVAPAERQRVKVNGSPHEHIRTTGPWVGPNVVLLDRSNRPEPYIGEIASTGPESAFYQFMWKLRSGDRGFIYRERVAEAKRSLYVDGLYSQAVVLAVTAIEVLVDWLLSLVLWEKGTPPAEAASSFDEGKLLRRLTTDLPSLLGGNWSTSAIGPVADWHRDAYLLRHRIVHGGRDASRPGATAALRSTHNLERHAMDRLCDRRTSYPRVVLMTVAEQGLRRRGFWSGKIRRFSENEARVEGNWAASFHSWADQLQQERLKRL